MRGLQIRLFKITSRRRITPARAGTTFYYSSVTTSSQDHPCTCGDYAHKAGYLFVIKGSPLHVRGLLSYGTEGVYELGDHPCTCGDYDKNRSFRRGRRGSPLHVRGLRILKPPPFSPVRITPARAGTTLKRSRNYLIFIIKYPIIYSLYELIFLPKLHLQELCEELFHQYHRILKQFPACSYSKISYLFLQTA